MTQAQFDATVALVMSKSWTTATLADVFRPLSGPDRNAIVGVLAEKSFNLDILYAAIGLAGKAPPVSYPTAPENDPNLPQVPYTSSKSGIPWLWIGIAGVAGLILFGIGSGRK